MGSCFSTKKSSDIQLVSKTMNVNEIQSINNLQEITTKEEFNRILNNIENNNLLIVCDFYATWCLPCLQIAPILLEWALNEYRNNVIFVKINIDINEDLFNQYSITILPSFLLFKQGKEIVRFTGADSINLKRLIDQYK